MIAICDDARESVSADAWGRRRDELMAVKMKQEITGGCVIETKHFVEILGSD